MRKKKLENLKAVKEQLAAKYDRLALDANSQPKREHFRRKAAMFRLKASHIGHKIAAM